MIDDVSSLLFKVKAGQNISEMYWQTGILQKKSWHEDFLHLIAVIVWDFKGVVKGSPNLAPLSSLLFGVMYCIQNACKYSKAYCYTTKS